MATFRRFNNKNFISRVFAKKVFSNKLYGVVVTGNSWTIHQQNTSTITGTIQIAHAANTYYAGQGSWLSGSNITLVAVDAILTAVGTINSKTYQCEIWTDSTSLVALVGASDGVTGNNSWSETSQRFVFSTPVSIVSGTSYAIVFTPNTAVDGANYARLSHTAAGGLSGLQSIYNSAGVRQTFSTVDNKLTIWKS